MKLSTCILCIFFIVTTAYSQKLGKHTVEEWQTIIDTTWGEGLSTEKKLEIFDRYWNAVDAGYAGFINLDVDWDALKDKYRPEVAEGVSRGRFAAIMDRMYMALMELHTHVYDVGVRKTSLDPGVPLVVFWGVDYAGDNGHFGAGLTPLPDSSALVYKVIENHPLGLEAGDIILGYDGVPWKILFKELLSAGFPLTTITSPFDNVGLGSSEQSVTHILLMSAGLNWHLFDTIDILKYGTNDTLHLSTDVLESLDDQFICTEQLKIAGVPMPDISRTDASWVSWGIVEDTQIGYIYVDSWNTDIGDGAAFTNAVNRLLDDNETTGLIIDFRTNAGGQMDQANGGFRRLFNFNLNLLDIAERSNVNDHFTLKSIPYGYCSGNNWKFSADPYLYDRPIAVLTGPATLSAGDYNAMRIKYHPMVKMFGKSSNTAFTCFSQGLHNIYMPPGWLAGYAPRNVYLTGIPNSYLMHVGFEVDEEVWLTPDDVAKGEDTVVKRAIEWIQNLAYAHDVTVDKTYLAPSSGTVRVSAQVENPNEHNLAVKTYISLDDTTVVDSLDLAQNDNIWSTLWSVGEGENFYHVSVKTADLDEGTARRIPNVAHFTSAGPVQIDSISDIRRRSSPTNTPRLVFDIYLKNSGEKTALKNIKATLLPDTSHPCYSPAGAEIRSLGDLDPGERKTARNFFINIKESCGSDTIFSIPFALDISSEDISYWKDNADLVVGLEEISALNLPLTNALYQNYPNPFNPCTTIEFQIPSSQFVTLKIYNLLGQEVATLVSEKLNAGNYKYDWDASGFGSGIYYYRLTTNYGFYQSKKLILIK